MTSVQKKLKLQLKYWKKLALELNDRKDRTEILVEELKSCLEVVKPPEPVVLPEHQGEYSPEELVVLCSDAQAGTEVIGKELGQEKWNYNTHIFRYRLRLYLKGIYEVVSRHRKAYPVNDVTVWLGGDLIEGERVFKPQMTFIDTNVMNQFFVVLYEVARFLSSLAGMFGKVKVVCGPGNHGRIATPKESSDFVSWEYVLYRNLQTILKDHANLEIEVPLSWYKVKNVNGTPILFMHAEDVYRYLQFPWYGMDRFQQRYFQMCQTIGEPFSIMCTGHFHQSFNLATIAGEMIGNGSFVGYTRFVQKKLGAQGVRPSQTIFFVHPRAGVTAIYKLKLDRSDPELWKQTMAEAYDIKVPVPQEMFENVKPF